MGSGTAAAPADADQRIQNRINSLTEQRNRFIVALHEQVADAEARLAPYIAQIKALNELRMNGQQEIIRYNTAIDELQQLLPAAVVAADTPATATRVPRGRRAPAAAALTSAATPPAPLPAAPEQKEISHVAE